MADNKEKTNTQAPPAAPAAASAPGTVVLKNKETAAKYDCTRTSDHIVHLPGKYSGLISNVTPEVAAELISQGHTAFVEKSK